MPKREDYLLIDDIKNCLRKILSYTNGLSFEQFSDDEKTADAVIRNFEITGEATKLLSEEFKSDNLQVEWKKLTGFRNVLVHQYFGIDYEIVWKIITTEVQQHLDFLETINLDE
jgi:uncharacterized protein with HEPN domain